MQSSYHTVTVTEATLSYAARLRHLKRLHLYELEPPFALQMNFHSDRGRRVCSLHLKRFTEQNVFHVGKLAFYSSFHPHIRVLLLLFLAAFTPTLLFLASYDSGLLIVFMA